MTAANDHVCPTCQGPVEYVKDWPNEEPTSSGGQLVVPLASAVYQCAAHGYWRIYINGASESVTEAE